MVVVCKWCAQLGVQVVVLTAPSSPPLLTFTVLCGPRFKHALAKPSSHGRVEAPSLGQFEGGKHVVREDLPGNR